MPELLPKHPVACAPATALLLLLLVLLLLLLVLLLLTVAHNPHAPASTTHGGLQNDWVAHL